METPRMAAFYCILLRGISMPLTHQEAFKRVLTAPRIADQCEEAGPALSLEEQKLTVPSACLGRLPGRNGILDEPRQAGVRQMRRSGRRGQSQRSVSGKQCPIWLPRGRR